MQKKQSNLILHLDVLITLGTIAIILWLNIPKYGGIIAACCIFAIMIVYLYYSLNPTSWLNLWVERVAHKINMKSLTRKPKSSFYGFTIFALGFIDFIPYYFLYYKAGLHILGCLCMICGAILKFIGLFAIYRSTKSVKGQIILTYGIMFGIWIFGSQLLYYTILIFTHITPSVN